MNLLHRRWDRLRERLMGASILLTLLGWMLAPTEMPWWWALIPTAVTLALLWWEARATGVPPMTPPRQLRRNRIGQLLPPDAPEIRRGRPLSAPRRRGVLP